MNHPSFMMALGLIFGGIIRKSNNVQILVLAMIIYIIIALGLWTRKHKGIGMLICILVSFFIGFMRMELQLREFQYWQQDKLYYMEAIVESIEEKDNTIVALCNTGQGGRINIVEYKNDKKTSGYQLDKKGVGYRVKISFLCKYYDRAYNYGNFDSRAYYNGKGIGTYGQLEHISYEKRVNYISYLGAAVRQHIADAIRKCAGDSYGELISSMTVGDRQHIDQDIKELLKENGLFHIMAISGLHIGIVADLLMYLIGSFVKKDKACIFCCILVGFYGIVAGSSISCVRAVAMYILRQGARLKGRKYNPMIAIGIAAIYGYMINPHYIYYSGFILSFAAIFAAVILIPKVNSYIKPLFRYSRIGYKKHLESIILALVDSIAINLVTIPLVAYYYYEIPIYSVLLNIIIIPLMSLVIGSALLGFIIYELLCIVGAAMAGIIAGHTIMYIGKAVLIFVEYTCELVSILPIGRAVTGKPRLVEVLGFYIIIGVGFIASEWFNMNFKAIDKNKRQAYLRKMKKKIRISIGAFSVLILFFLYHIFVNNHMTGRGLFVAFVNVGQGDCIIIRDSNKRVYMMDCGSTNVAQVGKYRAVPHLKALGISKIDYVFASHCDTDHISGIKEIIENNYIKIGCLVLGENNKGLMYTQEASSAYINTAAHYKEAGSKENVYALVRAAQDNGIPIIYSSEGHKLKSGEYNMNCLWPPVAVSNYDANELSQVWICSYKNTSLILTGDIGSDTEKNIIGKNIEKYISGKKKIILKVAHHGSRYSTSQEFIDIIKPSMAVISYGKNNYGHPSEEVLKRLSDNHIPYKETYEQGVMIKIR